MSSSQYRSAVLVQGLTFGELHLEKGFHHGNSRRRWGLVKKKKNESERVLEREIEGEREREREREKERKRGADEIMVERLWLHMSGTFSMKSLKDLQRLLHLTFLASRPSGSWNEWTHVLAVRVAHIRLHDTKCSGCLPARLHAQPWE